MNKQVIDLFMASKENLRQSFLSKEPDSYEDIVSRLIEAINPECNHELPDPKRVHEIDDGDYQGVLLFVIASGGYQPSEYWTTSVWYGSCSGCDTLQSIMEDSDHERRINDYMTLALHIVQKLKKIELDPA